MPNMHVSIFLRPKTTQATARAIVLEDTKSYSLTVRFTDGSDVSEIALYADDVGQLAEVGHAIVRECIKLMPVPDVDPFMPSAPPSQYVEYSQVSDPTNYEPSTYAINDAVEHQQAMESAKETEKAFF